MKTDGREFELDPETALKNWAGKTNLCAGAQGGHAVFDWRGAADIGNSWNRIKSHLVFNDGIEAGIGEGLVSQRGPSVADIEIDGRAIRESADRSTRGIRCVKAADITRVMKGLVAFESLIASGHEVADAEIAIAESSGGKDNSPTVDFLEFGERELNVQV